MKFITILAILFLVLFLLRILGLLFGTRSAQEEMLIAKAKSFGYNPIYDALKFPTIGSIICVAWLISIYF